MASFRVGPEHTGPPDLEPSLFSVFQYYGGTGAAGYASGSHITAVQHGMAGGALELLALPEGKSGFLLDIGCGTGMSSEVILGAGHMFVGVDVSRPMLEIARQDEDLGSGDFVRRDVGLGMPFGPGSFDGAIGVSAIQWLCHANASDENPRGRLLFFFQSLCGCLGRGSRAVFRFYPEDDGQCDLIMGQAHGAGFGGGLVVDFPGAAKRKKVCLVLMTGGVVQLPRALTGDGEESRTRIDGAGRRFVWNSRENGKVARGSRAWIGAKRQRQIEQGRDVGHESKYS